MNKMFKKLTLSLLVIGGLTTAATAQTYQKGNFLINAGAGTIGSGMGTAFGAAAEYGFTDQISGGASFMTSSPMSGFSYTRIGARASYHLDMGTEGLDAYAGPTVGMASAKVSFMGISASSSGMFYGAQAGARYMFASNIGIYAEVGYAGASGGGGLAANGGLALKF